MNGNGLSAFQDVPKTGVIYVMQEAEKLGFSKERHLWANLGQGMPETSGFIGAPPRINSVAIADKDQEYGPIAGIAELREAVAALYNELFRKDHASKYTAENVAICGGGRSSLTRIAASLGQINLGHFLPDYTAYEELLDLFRLFNPIPIVLDEKNQYRFSAEDLKKEILGKGLSALLISNPTNPTGKVMGGKELSDWIDMARTLGSVLIFDEFYSHYIWRPDLLQDSPISTAARFVEDVNKDPVVILDGLTKNWRYPGWRISWIVGPKKVIESVSAAGSFLDGGACRPLQRAAIKLLEPKIVLEETKVLHQEFAKKRTKLLSGLTELGFKVDFPPEGAFYVWASLEHLPKPLHEGFAFFQEALKAKVVTVPGEFFDVDPGKRRRYRYCRFQEYVRFSFGPPMEEIELGLKNIRKMIG